MTEQKCTACNRWAVKHNGKCVYIGTIKERIAKAKLLGLLEHTKPSKDADEMVKRARARYVDRCDPNRADHPFAYMM